jgi:Protein of unknown function (DUF1573)
MRQTAGHCGSYNLYSYVDRHAMRIISTILVAALAGVLAGGAVAYVEIRNDPDALDKLADDLSANTKPGDKETPRIAVDQPHFDFGTMQRGTTKSHEFVIRNIGAAPLKIRNGGTTCKCTLSEVADESIPPGGSAMVKLEWSAKSDSGPFRQTATILTNDPTQSQIELTVDGQILALSNVDPPEFLFEKLSVGEKKSAQVYVMAMLQDELTVKDPQISDPTIRDKFDVKVEPVEPSELPNKLAKRGYRVTMTTKDGLPVGRFHSWVTLQTDLPDAAKLEIPIVGQVVGDIGVTGVTGWNAEESVLNIGSVKSSEGGQGKVYLVVRGAGAADVKFDVKSKEPEELKITLGEPKKLKDTLVHVPVTIEIPRGTRPMVHLDTAQGEAARIVFSTSHSKIKELSLAVRFAVER